MEKELQAETQMERYPMRPYRPNPHRHHMDYHKLCKAYYHAKKTYKMLKHLKKHRPYYKESSSSRCWDSSSSCSSHWGSDWY